MKTVFKSVVAALLCLTCVASAQAADKVIKLEYKVPTNLELVTGKGDGQGAYIYKTPSLKSYKLLDVFEGDGFWTQWSNERKSKRREYRNSLFSKDSFSLNLGSTGNFVKIENGYVEKSKTVPVDLQPLTLDDFNKGESQSLDYYRVITKGKLKGCVEYVYFGEGGTVSYYGRIIDNVLVYFASFYLSYDEYESGINEGYFGRNKAYFPYSDNPDIGFLDVYKLTDQELYKLLSKVNEKPKYVVFKVNNKLQSVCIDMSRVQGKTVTETITF